MLKIRKPLMAIGAMIATLFLASCGGGGSSDGAGGDAGSAAAVAATGGVVQGSADCSTPASNVSEHSTKICGIVVRGNLETCANNRFTGALGQIIVEGDGWNDSNPLLGETAGQFSVTGCTVHFVIFDSYTRPGSRWSASPIVTFIPGFPGQTGWLAGDENYRHNHIRVVGGSFHFSF